MRGMVPLLLLIPTLASAGSVRVRVAALGEAESCRSDRALATQLRAISGLTVAEREFDFEATIEREGANWQISLRKPDGTVALRRSLAGAKECADVSFAAALIIERFVRALDLKVDLPGARQGNTAEERSGERNGADAKATDSKATDSKAAGTKPANAKGADPKAPDAKSANT
ncbi:MAG: hypothetical protein H6Q89_5316, partial [Myxococcaceae bacterium]|nr:hypothetical protein [Myxococcaceae bacterium]